ncbi:MAG TPA: hypothetical protein VNL15_06095 [Dehalococcoidia bacterium]|nr:hypothetical protein [Dehalococcoidia bacterium]
MPLIRDDDLVRIELPAAGEWVEVKSRLAKGDAVYVQQMILRNSKISQKQLQEQGANADIDLMAGDIIEAAEFATLDRAIKKWSFPEDVTPENIRRLDEESVEAIKARLNELYPKRTDEEKKGSAANGATPSSAREESPASSAG